ncbi:MAG TPA: BLUF domain-containing protein [Sphingomicrobium sp.]|jgi:hypothetical protein
MDPNGDLDFRRLVYASIPTGTERLSDLDRILAQARRNNGMNGISGVLVVGPHRYVQVLEGTPEAVGHIMDVIRDDERHTDVQVLDDVHDRERTFGGWTMANLPGGRDEAAVRRQVKRLLRNATEPVRQAFALLD